MAQLTKQALIVENNTNFPNNNTGYITPALLREFNTDMIDSNVNQTVYNTDSSSWTNAVSLLSAATSSYAISASVAAVDAAQQSQINQLIQFTGSVSSVATGSLLVTASATSNVITFTKGNGTQFSVTVADTTDLSSLNAFTQSQDTKNTTLANVTASFNQYTSSNDTKWSNLASQSGSFVTESETGSFARTNAANTFTALNTFNNATGSFTGSFRGDGTNLTGITASFSGIPILDEGTPQGTAVSLNFTGSAINASVVGGVAIIAVNTPDTGTVNNLTASFNSYTASNDTKWSTLGGQSGSWVTETESGSFLITASVNLNTITFTKGNNTTFAVTVNTGSGATDITALNQFTASQDTKNTTLASVTSSLQQQLTNIGAQSGSWSGGSVPAGTISGSAQITSLGFVSSSVTASSLITASVAGQILQFTRGNATTFNVTIPTGSQSIVTGSYAQFFDTTTQSGSANTPYALRLNSTAVPDGVILSGSTGLLVGAPGVYNIQFSLQASQGASSADLNVWFKKNGTNISNSDTQWTLPSNTKLVPIVNILDQANTGDVYQIWWKSTSANTTFAAIAAGVDTPEIPSAIVTIFRVDVGGGSTAVTTGSFNAFTSSINSYTASNDTKWTTLANVTSSLISKTGSYATTGSNTFVGNQIVTGDLTATGFLSASAIQGPTATFTTLNATTINAGNGIISSSTQLNQLGFAITGSNNFVGTETLSDETGNSLTIASYSGSYVFVQKGFASGSSNLSHITASVGVSSTPFGGNLIIKRDNNQNSIIISGSSNIITNPSANTAGFVRMLGNENLILANSGVPQFSGSMIASGVNTFNIFRNTSAGGAMTVRGASTGSFTMSSNYLGGTINLGTAAATDMRQAGMGVTIASNVIEGSINAIAYKTPLSASVALTTNLIGGAATLIMDSSSVQLSGLSIQGALIISSSYFPSTLNTSAATSVQVGLSAGNSNLIYTSGSNATFTNGRVLSGIGIVGNNNTFNANQNGDLSHVVSVIALGSGLGITGSSATYAGSAAASHGSTFVGRFNAQDGNRAKTAETVFAVGTGTSTSALKTGFLIDSGSNTFVEGTLNISGSTSFTGSAPSILSGSFSGSLITNLTDTYTDVAAVQQIVSISSGSYAGLVSGSLTNTNTLYIIV